MNFLTGQDIARFLIRVFRDKNKSNYTPLLWILCTIRLILYGALSWNARVDIVGESGKEDINIFKVHWDITLFIILSQVVYFATFMIICEFILLTVECFKRKKYFMVQMSFLLSPTKS
jgi:hypothetical protein